VREDIGKRCAHPGNLARLEQQPGDLGIQKHYLAERAQDQSAVRHLGQAVVDDLPRFLQPGGCRLHVSYAGFDQLDRATWSGRGRVLKVVH